MLPASGALLTVITPPATVHLAGDLSLTVTHWSRFLPSNKTVASEGGAVQVAPGVTTLGSGVHTSVSSGLGAAGCCAEREAATTSKVANARIFEFGMHMDFRIRLTGASRKVNSSARRFGFPQGLKPTELMVGLMYGLKPVPFRALRLRCGLVVFLKLRALSPWRTFGGVCPIPGWRRTWGQLR